MRSHLEKRKLWVSATCFSPSAQWKTVVRDFDLNNYNYSMFNELAISLLLKQLLQKFGPNLWPFTVGIRFQTLVRHDSQNGSKLKSVCYHFVIEFGQCYVFVITWQLAVIKSVAICYKSVVVYLDRKSHKLLSPAIDLKPKFVYTVNSCSRTTF